MLGSVAGSAEMHGFYEPHHRTGPREEEAAKKIDFEQQWQADIELAYGEMGLLPEQFLEMRPCDWHARKRGFFRKEEKQWNHTRHIMAALGGAKPKEIIKLSFDEEKIETVVDVDAARKRILERYKHLITTYE
jgi:hypothetical protein